MPGNRTENTLERAERNPVGLALAAIAVVHLSLTPFLYADSVESLLRGGLFNALDADPELQDLRSASFWYATTGLALLLVAVLVGRLERLEGRTSRSSVVGLFAIAIWGLAFTPMSGFVAVLAVASLAAYRRRTRIRQTSL